MADFKIQRGVSTMADATAAVTITAGSEYTAPSAASKAWISIVSTTHCSKSDFTNGADESLDHETVRISYPVDDITTSVTFTRDDTTGGCKVTWQIVEYTGSGGGANEIIVRGVGEIYLAYQDAVEASAAIASISSAADCVPFIQSIASTLTTDLKDSKSLATLDMINDGDDKVQATVSLDTGVNYVNYACVEFTGSNWTVQEVDHAYVADNTVETEAISSVGGLTNAFLEVQLRTSTDNGADEQNSHQVYLTTTTEVSFYLAAGATAADKDAKVYVISNSNMTVEHLTATQGTGGGEPEVINDTVTEVTTLDTTAIMGACATADGIGRRGSHCWMVRPTTTTNVELSRVETEYSSTFRYSVVQFPTEVAGGGSNTSKVHFYRQQQGVA